MKKFIIIVSIGIALVTLWYLPVIIGLGFEEVYFDNGNLKAEFRYKRGMQHGLTTKYYKNGSIKGDWNFKEGKQHGLTKKYYYNGQLIGEWNFEEGERQGVIKQYYEDGILKSVRNFEKGSLDGVVKLFYRNGDLASETKYKIGKLLDKDNQPLNGWSKIYTENGNLVTLEYMNGQPTGVSKKYHLNGNLENEIITKDDKLVSVKKYDKEGNFLSEYSEQKLIARNYNRQAYDIFLEDDNLEKGLELIEKALLIVPEDGMCLSTKAELLYALDRYDEAYEYIQKAINFEPENEGIKEDVRMIEYALEHFK